MSLRPLLSALIALCSVPAFAQIENDFKLPEKWAKDFNITLSYDGSMSGSYTEIKFTYDSCIYKNRSNRSKPVSRIYLLKEGDRVAILNKLREMNADKIKSEGSMNVVHDGWSQSICFNVHCIEGGTSAEMSDDDKNKFLDVYRYLEDFASAKKH
jgi:hypothetical protein